MDRLPLHRRMYHAQIISKHLPHPSARTKKEARGSFESPRLKATGSFLFLWSRPEVVVTDGSRLQHRADVWVVVFPKKSPTPRDSKKRGADLLRGLAPDGHFFTCSSSSVELKVVVNDGSGLSFYADASRHIFSLFFGPVPGRPGQETEAQGLASPDGRCSMTLPTVSPTSSHFPIHVQTRRSPLRWPRCSKSRHGQRSR